MNDNDKTTKNSTDASEKLTIKRFGNIPITFDATKYPIVAEARVALSDMIYSETYIRKGRQNYIICATKINKQGDRNSYCVVVSEARFISAELFGLCNKIFGVDGPAQECLDKMESEYI